MTNLTGTGNAEYVIGLGWGGPTGGTLCVYDDRLSKLDEIPTDLIVRIDPLPIPGQGTCGILTYEDSHPGTGMWRRTARAYHLSPELRLEKVGEWTLYDENGDIRRWAMDLCYDSNRFVSLQVTLATGLLCETRHDN
jgi:hypothetical protein